MASDATAGDRVLVDDGKVGLIVDRVEGDDVVCKVVEGGPVSNNKGISLPGMNVTAPALSEKDIDDLTFALKEGVDLVVEGEAVKVTDDDKLSRIADAYVSKYGEDWRFEVRDGAFHHGPGEAWVFEVAPSTAYGFGKGDYSHTRWRFDQE